MEDSLSSVQLRSASSTASSPGAEATVATVAIAQRVGADYSSKAGEIRVIDAFVEAVGGEVWTPIMMRERERGFSLFNIDLSSLDTEEEETDELDFRDLSRRIEDCSSRGMFAECSTLLDECIERSSRLQGSLNKETLSFMHRKAQCLHDAEKYDEALSIYEVCLSKRQATLGDLHLDTLITMNGLANNLRCLGKYDVAGEIFSNCLGKMRASLALLCGERRAETTDSTTSVDREEERSFRLLILEVANNLANVYTHIGEYDKAEDLFEDVLRTQKVMLGESHLFTINSLHNLSILYRKRGVLRKELACLTSLLSHKRRLFESGQCGAREMVDLMRLLAGCHASLGELERAKHVLEECISFQKEVLGDSVAMDAGYSGALRDLAKVLQSSRYFAKAELIYQELLDLSRSRLGDRHPLVLDAMHDLGVCLGHQLARENKLFLAEQSLETCLELRQQVLGPTHYDTFNTTQALAILHTNKRDFCKAIELLKGILSLQQSLGPQWFENIANETLWLATMHILASCYYKNGEYSTAQTYYEKTYNTRKRLLGASHPDTISCLMDLAANYTRLGLGDRAIEAYEECLCQRTTKLGEDHPDTIEVRNTLGNVRREYEGSDAVSGKDKDQKQNADEEW